MAMARYYGLWAREGDTFHNAESGEERSEGGATWLELREVRLYRLAEDGRLLSLTHAGSAEHRDGAWLLKNVQRDLFAERSVAREKLPELRWESRLDANALASGLSKPRNLTARELRTSIEYRERNDLDARDYQDMYWSRLFYPINVLALCLAAIPFAFGTLRSGGMGKRLFLGILFALGFWLLQMLFGRMAGALKFDYFFAYALPPTVMLLISGLLFRRRSS
jgi:lipopolysaccharide export system permease protein